MDKKTANIIISQDSDVGKSEKRFYEDRLHVKEIETRGNLKLTLAVISDGIGGENAGERAAEMTIRGVFQYVHDSTDNHIPRLLEKAITQTNADVFKEASASRTKRNMGATVAVAAIHENKLYVANVGDSRVYLIKGKKITQVTVDHSWANEVFRAGKLGLKEALNHPRKDELIRSIGYEPTVRVDLGLYTNGVNETEEAAVNRQGLPLEAGDKVVLCSDGLTKERRGFSGHYVENQEIVSIISDSKPEQSANRLVKKALERNTNDNVSAIVLEITGGRPLLPLNKLLKYGAPALVGLGAIAALFVFVFNNPNRNTIPVPTLPAIEFGQLFIADKQNLDFSLESNGTLSDTIQAGDFVDLVTGSVMKTNNNQDGFIRLGFPGQASLYVANDTELVLQDYTEMNTGIQLNRGRVIVQLPNGGQANGEFSVSSPNRDWAMINGSVMGVYFNPVSGEFYIDCLEGTCYYQVNGDQVSFESGSHLLLSGSRIVETAAGTRNELWQFVPGFIPTPTLTFTPTIGASPTATRTPRISPTPTLTETPDYEGNNWQDPVDTGPTETPRPGPTETDKPEPTETDRPKPTNTDKPEPTETDKPEPTETDKPEPTATALPECMDGSDNDNDGFIDMDDPSCVAGGGPLFDDESYEEPQPQTYQCSDNFDNDGDNLIDEDDPGCHRDNNLQKRYLPEKNSEEN